MLLHIPGVFSREEVQRIREALEQTEWADGKITAGFQSAKAKHNLQLPEDHPLAKEIGAAMIDRLWKNPQFMSAALPHKVFPPLVNCYTGGGSFDFHIDNAVRQPKGSPERVRTDLSATLFFSEPEDYDGGELVIQDTYGVQQVKLPAGIWCCTPAPVCTRSMPSPVAHVLRRFSGPKAWCVKTASAPCCSKWTVRSSN